MKERSENFRLVLKITVVFFLILFFVGSIYLWRTTHLKSESRAIARYLVSIKTAREETMSSHADEKFTQTESGPYGTTFTVENGIGKKNKNFFWINTEVYSSSLCKYLAKLKIGAVKIDKSKCDTSNEIVFYFAKFKSKKKVKGSPDMDIQPKGCPKNAECDEQDNILSCNEGYYLSDEKCLKCPANSINCEYESFECQIGFYRSEDSCVHCGTGVRACNDNGEPTECMTDFYPMDGKCVSCSELGPGFCSGYKGDSFSSASSASSTYNSSVVRTHNDKKTTKVQSESLKKTECQDGYYRKGGSCVACPSYYKTCDKNTGYFTCQDGYVKNTDRTACVKKESCYSKATDIRLSDSGMRVSVEGDTIVLSNNQTSQPVIISQDLDFSGCNVKINTASETYLLGDIYAKNLTIFSPKNKIYTYRTSDVPPTLSSGKKIVCSGDLKINGSFYSDRSVDVAGNLIITEFIQMTPSNVHISGYVSGDSIATAKHVRTPITVEGYVSVSDMVHNVKSGDYINASLISSGEAQNNITVEQISLNGKLISKNGDIIVTDSRKREKSQDNLFSVHVDFGSELSVLNGSMNIVSGLDVLNLGNIYIARNLDVTINGIFRNWNQLYIGGSMNANTDIRLAGFTHPNGNKINSQTLVCGGIFGSGKIQLNTVASLSVGAGISTSMKTQVVKYTGACEQGEGKLSAGRAAYYIQNYETYLNNGQCLLNKKSEEGSFSTSTQDNCYNISWCQKNRYCS